MCACRLLLTATVLAAKFLDDVYYTNRHYAKVGGVSLAELNDLERHMLMLLAYRLRVSTADMQWHLKQVLPPSFTLFQLVLSRHVM